MSLHESQLPDVLKRHQSQWNQLQSAWSNERMPQALLFVGSLDCALVDFIRHLTQLIACKKENSSPCGECIDCLMVMQSEHPDVDWIKPEKNSGPIKIDQIREFQSYSYLTPQRATHRLIVIESADRMNVAAANALLKILEEPAQHIIFLLIATQMSTILPTVLSRCQVMRFFSYEEKLSATNFLHLVKNYSQDSEQTILMNQLELILSGLVSVIEQKEHPCVVAAQWSRFDLGTLLWFLYLVYAQIQVMQINVSITGELENQQLNNLTSLLSPIMIFAQIDKINKLQRKLNRNVHVNSILVLEDLLLALQ